MVTWTKIADNLVRHSGGTIYLRARVGGKPIRVSLGTSDLRLAKISRDARLDALRADVKTPDVASAKTIGDFISLAEQNTVLPHLKPTTARNYRFTFSTLRNSIDLMQQAQTYLPTTATTWWRQYCKTGCSQTVNLGLSLMKKVGNLMVERGLVTKNPFGHLKRIPLRKNEVTIPSARDMEAVITEIRKQSLPYSEEAANMVAFLAYSGLRIGEATELLWKDVDTNWLTVTGGERGTKNGKTRRLPINPRLKAVLQHMGWSSAGELPPVGLTSQSRVFGIKSPRGALRGACLRLKLKHIHPHMLRHHFASWAIESGVDTPTVSRWLGHSDGGVLAMKTYGHLRDDHSLRMSSLLATHAYEAI